MHTDLPDRLTRAQKAAADAGVDAVLVAPSADLRYLTGYDAIPLERLTCLVLPTHGEPVLVVPELERPAALASPVGSMRIDVRAWGETEDAVRLVTEILPGSARRVAVDDHMPAAKVLALRAAMPGTEQVLAGPLLGPLRMRKSAEEVAALRDAGAAIDRVHARMGEWLRPGRTEREVGRDIATAIVDEGHISADFVIVAAGANSASPHADLSERVIRPGDPVVVDIGGTTAAGYRSDSTRTYLAGGEPPDDFARYYPVLQRAQATACEYAGPGVTAESVDTVARSVIADAGFGEAFMHRTGHGIGLETHEPPYVVSGNDLRLEPGMAFSVEPGIYLQGRHGARIEDIVVVTEDGAERLNHRPRDLVVLEA